MGFWVCLILLVGVTVFGLYCIVDQGVSLTYMREGYEDTENDLNTLIEIINDTDMTKAQVEKKLKTHRLYEFMDFSKNEISIERVTLIFKDERLISIEKQW